VALEFVREGHFYLLDGVRIPNVTRVTDALSSYAGVPLDVLQRKAEIGDAVHFATELDDADDLDDSTLPDEIRGYVEGWRKFKRDTGWITEASEVRVFSKTYRYAGTLDAVGYFNKLKGIKPHIPAIVDKKCTFMIMPSVGPQVAAYTHAYNEMKLGPKVTRRFAVQLRAGGDYNLHECSDPSDFSIYLSALSLLNWRVRNNLEKAA
jgi:hypothetical protein